MPKDPAAVELGRKGGKARAAKVKDGELASPSGAPKRPRRCPVCLEMQESAVAARKHHAVAKCVEQIISDCS